MSLAQQKVQFFLPVSYFSPFPSSRLESYRILANYTPRASVVPSVLDLTSCPYSWPFCRQPIFHGSMPLIFNATILNGMGVVGWLEGSPQWEPDTSATQGGSFLEISFTHSPVLWPWSGYLGIFIRVNVQGRGFSGKAEGKIHFTVVSPAGKGEKKPRRWECQLAVHVNVVPTPPRERRLLWDQFHSIRYPPGYIPRDNLEVRTDILDWHGDHPHTNFHGLFNELRARGYFLEVLGSPLSCFNASEYGALLIIDSEDEFFPQEVINILQILKKLESPFWVIIFLRLMCSSDFPPLCFDLIHSTFQKSFFFFIFLCQCCFQSL